VGRGWKREEVRGAGVRGEECRSEEGRGEEWGGYKEVGITARMHRTMD
jgi:hypothetical protein